MTTYRAVVGLSYPDKDGTPKRVEAGKQCADLPDESVGWLLEQALIEKVAK